MKENLFKGFSTLGISTEEAVKCLFPNSLPNNKEIKEDSNVETRDLKCPNCSANLNVSTMNDIYKCEYCDSNIYIKEV